MRSKLTAAASLLAVLVHGGSAIAVECVPAPMLRLSAAGGGPGTSLKVTGSTFDVSPTVGPVSLFWDGTCTGTSLGQVPVQPDGNFMFDFQVPANASEGAHVVTATQRDDQGRASNVSNIMFSVTGEPGPPVSNRGSRPTQLHPIAAPSQPAKPNHDAGGCAPVSIIKLSAHSGRAGTGLTVTGSTFDAGLGANPVTISWDATCTGRTLGQVPVQPDMNFTFDFHVPADASAGPHVISAAQHDGQGRGYNTVDIMFSVTSEQAPPAAPSVPGSVQLQPVAALPQRDQTGPIARKGSQPFPRKATAVKTGPPNASGGQVAGSALSGAQQPASLTADQTRQETTTGGVPTAPGVPGPAAAVTGQAVGNNSPILAALGLLVLGFVAAGARIFRTERRQPLRA